MTSAISATSLRHAVATHRKRAEEAAPHEDFPELPILDDRKRYIVLGSADLQRLVKDIGVSGVGYSNVSGEWHSVLSRG